MASSRMASYGPDLLDVDVMWTGLEEIDRVRIEVTIKYQKEARWEGLVLDGAMWGRDVPGTGAALLVSTRLKASTKEFTSLGAALTHLLYKLDGQLAQLEMDGKGKQR